MTCSSRALLLIPKTWQDGCRSAVWAGLKKAYRAAAQCSVLGAWVVNLTSVPKCFSLENENTSI